MNSTFLYIDESIKLSYSDKHEQIHTLLKHKNVHTPTTEMMTFGNAFSSFKLVLMRENYISTLVEKDEKILNSFKQMFAHTHTHAHTF